jgi:hypothetical protein
MEKEKRDKRVPVQIADWPWWLEQPYVGWWWVIGAVVVSVVGVGRRRGLDPWSWLVVGVAILMVMGMVWFINWFINLVIEGFPARGEPLPAAICPKCGYDLRGTLMRCPECGADTPFKMWLDKQNALERYLFKKHLEQHAHVPGEEDPQAQGRR